MGRLRRLTKDGQVVWLDFPRVEEVRGALLSTTPLRRAAVVQWPAWHPTLSLNLHWFPEFARLAIHNN
jgi:hypothetical protein